MSIESIAIIFKVEEEKDKLRFSNISLLYVHDLFITR